MVLHGLADNRIGMAGYAQLLLAHGYTVLPEATAHGVSGGTLATSGWQTFMTGPISCRPRRIRAASSPWANRWGRRSCCGLCRWNPDSVPWLRNRHFPHFERLPTTGWGSRFTPVLGWGGRCCGTDRGCLPAGAVEVRVADGRGFAVSCRGGGARSRASDSWTD